MNQLPRTGSLRDVDEFTFRMAVRHWLQTEVAHLCHAETAAVDLVAEVARRRAYAKALAASGWAGLLWPVEHGGRDCSLSQHYVFAEEAARAGAPEALNRFGVEIAAPVIMEMATPEQCAQFLPDILNCERLWCQGFSEPDAGSDLASLRTRATPDNDVWRIDGEKIWTTLAEFADYCLILARTDSSAAKHRGIGAFVVDLHSPGVDLKPIQQISGPGDFCGVTYDSVQTVPNGLIATPADGWRVAMRMLFFERGTNFVTRQISLSVRIDALIAVAGEHAVVLDDVVRADLADLFSRSERLRALAVKRASASGYRSSADDDIALNSAAKLFWSEAYQKFGQVAVALGEQLGDLVTTGQQEAWRREYLESRASTIYAGTSQIQRNIIAERGLQLRDKGNGGKP